MTVRVGVRDGVATLTLDRPEARNALNLAMCDALLAAAQGLDAATRLVLLRAKGPAFCAGADLKERQGMTGAQVRARRILGKRLAKDLMFTGRILCADEAERHGLVARLVPADRLEAELDEIAQTVGAAPAKTLALAKRAIDRGVELDPKGALETELAAIGEQLASGEWMGKR